MERQYFAPGRINLIGEHTDYNGGYVFPGAIDKGIHLYITPNKSNIVKAYSEDYDQRVEFSLEQQTLPKEGWARYIFGVIKEIEKRGKTIQGFDCHFTGDVPLGAGLSSSAALESVFAFALNDIYDLGLSTMDMALIGQATEHNYCGVKCGIMDQFASLHGKKDSLIRLDCSSMQYEYFPFKPQGYRLVLIDTLVKHELASSAYNKRRESCERVCSLIKSQYPEVNYLSDATMDMLDKVKGSVSQEDYLRAKYVIEEKERVLLVCQALQQGDYQTVGKCMYATHKGMSKDYEVSCEELDLLNQVANECQVTGSRVMGGGFGGCTINLVKEELYEDFITKAKQEFAKTFGHEPKVYNVVISEGARRIK